MLRDDDDQYDNEFFEIDSASGEVTFITPPNFEAAADDNENNVYDVKIDAIDSDGGIGSMLLHVTVTDEDPDTNLSTPAAGTLAETGTSGPDDVVLQDSHTGGSVALGAGQDYVLIDTGAIFTTALSTISTGADDDKVVIAQTGANTNTPSIDLGGGDDIIELNSENSGVYTISLGTGSDTVRIGSDSITAVPTISLFTNDDTLDLSALNLSTIDTTTSYSTLAAAQSAVSAAAGPDIAYATAGSDTYVVISTDTDGTADITLQLLGVTNFDTDSIML